MYSQHHNISTNSLFMGKTVLHLPKCASTNTVAANLARTENWREGTLIITDEQKEGRGQRGNSWQTAPRLNFTGSFLLKPSFLHPAQQFSLSVAVALALHGAVASLVAQPPAVKIKWPNDLLLNGQKVAGILIENSWQGNVAAYSIIGIGLNVAQVEGLPPNATSLHLAGANATVAQVAGIISEHLEAQYLQLKAGNHAAQQQVYLQRLYGLGQRLPFRFPNGEEMMGTITGVNEAGRLLWQHEGQVQAFDLQEISHVLPAPPFLEK